jgi:ribosome-binding factor A
MESKRQKQTGKIIQVALSDIFQRDLQELLQYALVTVVNVHITPDLFIARIYLSIFNHPKPKQILEVLDEHKKYIRGLLGNKIRNKMRTIPELEFYLDDTLDEVFKLEQLLKEVKEKDEAIAQLRGDTETTES